MRRFAVLALALLLSGCAPVSLSGRAIVKAVFFDAVPDGYRASIVVFSCEPTTDAASAEGQAHIYSGEGADVAQALADAADSQTKQPFYAQNSLLFLGSGCMDGDPTEILEYFGEEDASRKDVAVYLVPMDAQEFAGCGDTIAGAIHEAEGLARTGGARGIFGAHESRCEGGFSGILPILELNGEEGTASGVTSAALYQDGRVREMLSEEEYQLALVLLGKSGELTLDGTGGLSADVKGVTVRRNASAQNGGLTLSLRMTGTMMTVSRDGRALYAEEAKAAAPALNESVEKTFERLAEKTFGQGHDVFGFAWWLRGENSAEVARLEEAGTLWEAARLDFQCGLRGG